MQQVDIDIDDGHWAANHTNIAQHYRKTNRKVEQWRHWITSFK